MQKKSMGKDMVVLSASRITSYAISLIGTMILARFRTLSEYGTYSQLLLVINLFTSFLSLGLPSCLNYFLARADSREERNRFLSIYYTLNTLIGLVIGVGLVIALPVIESYFKNQQIGTFWLFLLVYPWANIIAQSVENLLVAHKRTDYLSVYRIAHSISVVFTICFVEFAGLSFAAYVYIYLAVEACFAIAIYLLAIKLDGFFKFRLDFGKIKEILVFAIPLGLATAVGTINQEMDKLMIGYLFSTDEYAIYANAAKELPIKFIATSVTAVLLPVIARLLKDKDEHGAVRLWKEATSISFLINCYFAIALSVFSREAIVFLYSEKYAAGAMVFSLYSLVLLFRSTYFGMILQSSGKTKKILLNSIFTISINCVGNIVFYFLFGFSGPAISTVLALAWSSGFQLFLTAKQLKMSIRDIFPWKNIAIILGANLVLGCVFVAAQKLLPLERIVGNEWEAILLAMVWFGLYLFVFRNFIKKKAAVLRSY